MFGFREYFGETHTLIRQKVRKFVEGQINHFVNEWEEKGEFPKALYHIAGEAGILGIGYHKAYGCLGGNIFIQIVCIEELMQCGSACIVAGLDSLDISILKKLIDLLMNNKYT